MDPHGAHGSSPATCHLLFFVKILQSTFAALHPGEVNGCPVGRNSLNALPPYYGSSVTAGVIRLYLVLSAVEYTSYSSHAIMYITVDLLS